MVHRRRRRPYSHSRRTFPTPITRAPLTSRRTGTCLHLSMFAAAAIPEANSNRSRRSRATVTMQSSGSRASHSATVKSPCGADRTQDLISGRLRKNCRRHLATIVPVAAAHPPLALAIAINNVGETYDVQWLTLTSGRAGQQNLSGDQKFWRSKFLDAYKKHIAFKTLDSFVGNPSANFQRILKHPTAASYYDAMVPAREQFQKITMPILTITGQYDGDELGALSFYRDHLANASSEARAKNFLIIGPWDHAGTRTPTDEVAGVKFGGTSLLDLNDLHRQWYDWTIKGGPKPEFLKNQVAYYLLAAGNSGAQGEWKYADSLETLTANSRTFYLDSKSGDANGVFRSGTLTVEQPKEGADRYTYDPLDMGRGENVEGVA